MHTWTNRRHDENFIKERLDCAVANIEWTALFHEVTVFVLAARALDHKPLLMCFIQCDNEASPKFCRSFKFEAKWQ
jgi:hypothetical protein